MMERRAILDLWERLCGDEHPVLATVVRVEGSSYRASGAHLLIGDLGAHAGSVSGGCLEEELLRKAKWLTSSGPVLRQYSTFFEDSSDIPYGLGCGGRVELLIERADSAEAQAVRTAMIAALSGEGRVIATVLPDDAPMARAVWSEQGTTVFASKGFAAETLKPALAWATSGRTPRNAAVNRIGQVSQVGQISLDGRSRRVFVEFAEAQPSFYIFGAGDDAIPLADLAGRMGWSVKIADSRQHLATNARFPRAQVSTLAAGVAGALRFRPADSAVIMTHRYEQDRAWLQALLPAPLAYLGLLGARSRSRSLVEEAAAAVRWTIAECLERLHAPVGLDLGGDGSEAVALAIVSQAHARLHGRSGQSRGMSLGEFMEIAPAEARACRR